MIEMTREQGRERASPEGLDNCFCRVAKLYYYGNLLQGLSK